VSASAPGATVGDASGLLPEPGAPAGAAGAAGDDPSAFLKNDMMPCTEDCGADVQSVAKCPPSPRAHTPTKGPIPRQGCTLQHSSCKIPRGNTAQGKANCQRTRCGGPACSFLDAMTTGVLARNGKLQVHSQFPTHPPTRPPTRPPHTHNSAHTRMAPCVVAAQSQVHAALLPSAAKGWMTDAPFPAARAGITTAACCRDGPSIQRLHRLQHRS
jgi:hypothetical protein